MATPKGAGRRFSACSYAPACTGSSSAVTCPRAFATHRSRGIDGALASHGDAPLCHATTASAASSAVQPRTAAGSSSRSVIQAIDSKRALDLPTGRWPHPPAGQPAAAAPSPRGTSHRRSGTAGGPSGAEPRSASRGGSAGAATLAPAKLSGTSASPDAATHAPRTRHGTVSDRAPGCFLPTDHGRQDASSVPTVRRADP
mmetsp:Transcript_1578/g.5144  ORF Transcript_1578/g.5144 Transcript_1578/m.5144 type:complete len:200 (-) Transcript_1578:1103-1702(-)